MPAHAFILLSLLALSACAQPTPTTPLSDEKTFKSLVFEASRNASAPLDKDYAAVWRADKRAWVAGSVPAGTDAKALAPTFSLSDGARASVDGREQVSGSTPQDFSAPVDYRITAADGSWTTQRVSLTVAMSPVTPLGNVQVRFGSWNLNDCDKDDNVTRYAQIAAAIKAAGIKVLACCEIQLEGDTGADIANLQSALDAIGWSLPYSAGIKVTPYGSEPPDDIAVLSAYPVTGKSTVPPASFTDSSGKSHKWPRAMLQADLSVDSKTVHLLVGHLKAMEDDLSLAERRAEAKALAAYLRSGSFSLSSDFVIISGDMNTVAAGDRSSAGVAFEAAYPTLSRPTLDYLRLKDDAESGNDFWASNESNLPATSTHEAGGVLDHIILSPAALAAYIPQSVKVFIPSGDCSDHYPVCLDLEL
jgi:endonuclease/exonuclease/phosphatase family metal-dependent hydrolase